MGSVLLITYHFPPFGGVAVQRVLKFAKFLPEHGWRPTILAAKEGDYHWPYYDHTLMNHLPHPLTVRHAIAIEPQSLLQVLRRLFKPGTGRPASASPCPAGEDGRRRANLWKDFLSNYVLIPDKQIMWLPFAVALGRKIVRDNRVDLIYSTAPPFTAHLVGLLLSRMTGRPWVADFRDLWTQDPVRVRPWLPQKIAEAMERQVLRSADYVVTFSDKSTVLLCDKYNLPKAKFAAITNGFDPEDWRDIKAVSKQREFNLVYTGLVNGRDTLKPFLTALSLLPDIIKERMKVIFVGGLADYDQARLHELHLDDLVEVKSFVPHREALAYQLMADALLLTFSAYLEGEWQLSGKVFEYLAARKVILAIVPEGAAADLVRETGAGIVVHPDDIDGIRRQLLYLYDQHLSGNMKVGKGVANDLRRYERAELTRQLAQIFNKIMGGSEPCFT